MVTSSPCQMRPYRVLAQAPVLFRKSRRSAGARPPPPSTMQRRPRRACPRACVAPVMRRVRAVGGDEVDQRFRVLQVLHEVGPARVGLELGCRRSCA